MRGRNRSERIQELLDGLLRPAEEACVRALVESDPDWARDHRQAQVVRALLGEPLDVDPPVDLAPSVLKAVTTDRVRRAFRFRLPSRVENALALAGAAALAMAVFGGTRTIGAGSLDWLVRGVVVSTNWLVAFVDRVAELAASFRHLDWVGRLVSTLSEAARTVLATSAEPLLGLTLLGGVLTVALLVALKRADRASRERGWGHAHLPA